jgi:hypothetical protein
MLEELEAAAKEINISRQAVIKTMLRQALDQRQSARSVRRRQPNYISRFSLCTLCLCVSIILHFFSFLPRMRNLRVAVMRDIVRRESNPSRDMNRLARLPRESYPSASTRKYSL